MAMNKRGLGRGIQALFDGSGDDGDALEITEQREEHSPLMSLPLEAIVPNPEQPRQYFSESALADLASSISRHGILQPLLVRPGQNEGQYELVAGERRLRAAKLAGLADVPALVRDLDDQEALIVTLLENLQREDLNPIEEARGLEALKNAMNLSVEQLAETLGQGRSTIAHALRLLKFEPVIQDDLAEGRLTASHAKCLASLPEGEARLALRQHIIENGLSTREADEAAAFWNEHGKFAWTEDNLKSDAGRKPKSIDPDMLKLANNIGATLNCRAKISGSAEKGRISIAYESNAQLYDLLEKLGLQLAP